MSFVIRLSHYSAVVRTIVVVTVVVIVNVQCNFEGFFLSLF